MLREPSWDSIVKKLQPVLGAAVDTGKMALSPTSVGRIAAARAAAD
jgi:hypothetical protein